MVRIVILALRHLYLFALNTHAIIKMERPNDKSKSTVMMSSMYTQCIYGAIQSISEQHLTAAQKNHAQILSQLSFRFVTFRVINAQVTL